MNETDDETQTECGHMDCRQEWQGAWHAQISKKVKGESLGCGLCLL
jgi:hypothetical protein